MVPLSVVIITYNEEQNIERCLKAVHAVADEIVVLDSGSIDRTVAICESFGAKVFEQPFLGYVEQKNRALEFATYPHVLSVDADEVLSEELKQSILKVKSNWSSAGYSFNRLTNYCGSWIRHSGWYPDRKLRLFDRRAGKWCGDKIHERYLLHDGSAPVQIAGDLLHYSYNSIDQHIEQIKKFTTIMSEVQFRKGKRPGVFKLIGNPLWCFINQYFLRRGFLDGFHGLVVCVLSATANFIKYAKTRELFRLQGQNK
jgi:glycosyltransferase involved in cell wall biosynthesis